MMRTVLLALALVACDGSAWAPAERVAPFREEPFGPGLETGGGGRRIDLVEIDGPLVARYRSSSNGLRVYDADATRLGRVRPSSDGWDVVRADGSVLCTLSVATDDVGIACDERDLAMVRDEGGWSIHSGERQLARVHQLTGGGWGLTYGADTQPTARFEEGRLSIQTHADARTWIETDPLDWHPAVIVVSRLEIDDVDGADLELVRGALVFAMARVLDATPRVRGLPEP